MNTETRRDRAMSSAAANLANGLESVSGVGSSVANSAKAARMINDAIEKYAPSRVLDVPCGDCRWIRTLGCWGETQYIGVDINTKVIADLQSEEWGEFKCLDVVCDELPPADLVICRDLLQHLTLKDGLAVLKNITATGLRWLAITSHSCGHNEDLTGDEWAWRPLSVFLPPFDECFGNGWRVVRGVADGKGQYGKMMLILERIK